MRGGVGFNPPRKPNAVLAWLRKRKNSSPDVGEVPLQTCSNQNPEDHNQVKSFEGSQRFQVPPRELSASCQMRTLWLLFSLMRLLAENDRALWGSDGPRMKLGVNNVSLFVKHLCPGQF